MSTSVSSPNDPRYFPMLLTESTEGDRVAALISVWHRYQSLSQEMKDILTSDELSLALKSLQDTFGVDIDTLGKISLLVRKFLFDELELVDLEKKIGDALAVMKDGDRNQAQAIVQYIQKKILTLKPKPKVETVTDNREERLVGEIIKLPLLQALAKYQNLGNQLITNERIRVKSQSEPVRPSLTYWIKYYRDELGIGQHDSVQRGNFLFRSENGKRLSAEERERLSLILKSLEENMPLEIDTSHSEIVFPIPTASPVSPHTPLQVAAPITSPTSVKRPYIPQPHFSSQAPSAPVSQPASPRGNSSAFSFGSDNRAQRPLPPKAQTLGTVSFSSQHVLPAEKEENLSEISTTPSQTSSPRPVVSSQRDSSAKPQTPPYQPDPFHIYPVSMRKKE